MNYRLVCWNIDSRGAVGESLLHLCFLNATKPHYDLAKILLDIYPSMIHDIYISDEYYGMLVILLDYNNYCTQYRKERC